MPRQRAGGEQIIILGTPAEFVDQRAEHDRAVDDPPGDDDIGAGIERGGDREGAEIGVGGQHAFGEGRPGEHVAHALRAHIGRAIDQLVARHRRDREREPRRRDPLLQRRLQPERVQRAGIGDDADALAGDLMEMRAEMDVEEIRRKAARRIGLAHPPEQPHRAFRQIIEHQIIEPARRQQLRHSQGAVGEIRRAAADAHLPHAGCRSRSAQTAEGPLVSTSSAPCTSSRARASASGRWNTSS
jgi:hypothetical protein